MSRRCRRGMVCLAVTALAVIAPTTIAAAHPLGNFTVNSYSGLIVTPHAVTIDHVIDLAEIPTVQARREVDRDGDGAMAVGELRLYAGSTCTSAAAAMRLQLDDRPHRLEVSAATAATRPGQAGLPTLRIECDLRTAIDNLRPDSTLAFADTSDRAQVGWREVTAQGDGVTLTRSDVPVSSVSLRLAAYPPDLLAAPLDNRTAQLRLLPGGPRLSPDSPHDSGLVARGGAAGLLGSLVDGELQLFLVLLAVLVAIGTGAVHALAPGHGKTVMAFYLASQRTDAVRSAVTVAATVTATHTGGVLVLGLLISGGLALAPERLYSALTAISGAIVVAVGAGLLRTALRARARVAEPAHGAGLAGRQVRGHVHAHEPSPGHGHTHKHHDVHPLGAIHQHDHQPSRAGLAAIGVAGGLLPSPTALIVLLGTAALGRAWLGVILVVAFGAGMAVTLTATGLALSRLHDRLHRPGTLTQRLGRLHHDLPVGLATAVIALGLALVARGAL